MKFLINNKILIIFFISLILVSADAFAGFKASALPTVENPKKLVLENDSLKMEINLDWQLLVPILEYKPQDINLIQSGKEMPLCKFGVCLYKIVDQLSQLLLLTQGNQCPIIGLLHKKVGRR